jgi:hypothetical protein
MILGSEQVRVYAPIQKGREGILSFFSKDLIIKACAIFFLLKLFLPKIKVDSWKNLTRKRHGVLKTAERDLTHSTIR